MSLITKHNYEAYLLDYVEENLSPEQIAELMLFLEIHPDLKVDLDEFKIHELIPSEISLTIKDKLKKDNNTITLDNYENFIINEIEGGNTTKISASLHSFLEKNPNAKSDFIRYQKTKLIASPIFFDDKKFLKKKDGKVIPLYWWYSSAAAVILILFLLKGLNFDDKNESNPIANKTEVPENEELQEVFITEEKEDIIEEKKLAEVDIKEVPKVILHKRNQKASPKFNPSEDEAPKEIMAHQPKNEIKETKDSIPPIIEDKILVKEILYADNVTITYESEEHKKTTSNKPPSRFKIIKEILNQRVKKKFLQQEKNKYGEVTAYAVNVSGVGFSKNKRKNKR